jgi:predicted RNase H-like nuclease
MRTVTGNTDWVRVTGVDGCRDGWAAVELDVDAAAGLTGAVAVRVAGSLTEVLAGTAAGQVVGIDMPLGLLARGWRTADGEVRRKLGPRRSSIFGIPPAPVWQQPDYRAALAECRRLTGQGFSIQAWGLRPKLLEAGQYRRAGPQRLYEVHPELSFAGLAGAPLPEPKHRPAGQALRRSLLAAAGLDVPDDPAWRRVAADVLDAAAVAWTARRIATGQAGVLPDPPQTGEDGQEIAIRY